jgi:hypothetical protein
VHVDDFHPLRRRSSIVHLRFLLPAYQAGVVSPRCNFLDDTFSNASGARGFRARCRRGQVGDLPLSDQPP